MKKFLILILISLNLVACSKNDEQKENGIKFNETTSINDNTINNADKTINNTEELKKDNNIKFEICDEIVKYEQNDRLYYKLSNNYGIDGNQSVMDFLNSENSLEKLKNFNNELKIKFNYNELHYQPLVYNGYFENDIKFSQNGIINEKIHNEQSKEFIYQTKLNTLMIGKTLYNSFDDYIEEGRNFKKGDFIVDDPNQEISLILGNDYKNIYKIGDELYLSLHEKVLKFKVVGFLKKDIQKFSPKNKKSLNETIIMPFYDINYIPNDTADEFYQKIYYMQKNEGHIKVNETEENEIIKNVQNIENIYYSYLEEVEELSKKHNLLFSIPICPTKI